MLKNDQEFYRLSRDKIIQLLSTSRKNGLTEKESVQRRKKHGENRLPQKKSLNLVNLFLNQF